LTRLPLLELILNDVVPFATAVSAKEPVVGKVIVERPITNELPIAVAGITLIPAAFRFSLYIIVLPEPSPLTIMSIELRSADMRLVVAALRRMPGVGRVHSTNGRWDLIAEIATGDLAALDRTLTEIRALKPVANSETSILLATYR